MVFDAADFQQHPVFLANDAANVLVELLFEFGTYDSSPIFRAEYQVVGQRCVCASDVTPRCRPCRGWWVFGRVFGNCVPTADAVG